MNGISKNMKTSSIVITPESSKDQYIFFCCNTRTNGQSFCGGEKTEALLEYCRETLKAHKEKRPPSDTRILKANKTGCLGRCSQGPNVVVFPDNTWHRCTSKSDVDAVLHTIL